MCSLKVLTNDSFSDSPFSCDEVLGVGGRELGETEEVQEVVHGHDHHAAAGDGGAGAPGDVVDDGHHLLLDVD